MGEKGVSSGGDVMSSAAALGCTGQAGNPGVMEAKQHGGSSALQALTAIDSIREESSSIADSGMLAAEGFLEEAEEGCEDSEVSGSLRKHSDSTECGGEGAGGSDRKLDSSRGSATHEGSSWSSLLVGLLPRRSTSDGEVGQMVAGEDVVSHTSSAGAAAIAAGRSGGGGLYPSGCKQDFAKVGELSGGRINSGSSTASVWGLDDDDAEEGSASGSKHSGAAGVGSGRPGGGILKARSLAGSPDAVQELGGASSDGKMSPVSPRLLPGSLTCLGNGSGDVGSCSPMKTPFSASSGSPDADRSVKRVRFTVERPVGATASRDRSLLYTAPELMQGHR
jgi:hypothetical protein